MHPKLDDAHIRLASKWALRADSRLEARLTRIGQVQIDIWAATDGNLAFQPSGPPRSSGQVALPLLLRPPPVDRLLPHQIPAVEWLLAEPNRLLADDMGLGKTVEAISALRFLVNSGEVRRTLVVCPKSMIGTWLDEFAQWAPELIAGRFETAKSLAHKSPHSLEHVLVGNYEQLRESEHPALRNIDLVIGDEAHRLRNLGSAISAAFREVDRGRTWLLSGTPIERDLLDLASLMSILEPERFAPSDASLSSSVLREKASDYIMRRTKESIQLELPPVSRMDLKVELLPTQRKTYREIEREFRTSSDRLSEINRLRRVCDFEPTSGESAKVNETISILRTVGAKREKAVVFSYLLEPIRLLVERCAEELPQTRVLTLDGSQSQQERQDCIRGFVSGSAPAVLIASLRAAGEGLTLTVANHVILFNQWWNPSSNNQAIDRVIRIGQTRPVSVYRYTCRDTIEEALDKLLRSKEELFRKVIGELQKTKGDIGIAEAQELLGISAEIERKP